MVETVELSFVLDLLYARKVSANDDEIFFFIAMI